MSNTFLCVVNRKITFATDSNESDRSSKTQRSKKHKLFLTTRFATQNQVKFETYSKSGENDCSISFKLPSCANLFLM